MTGLVCRDPAGSWLPLHWAAGWTRPGWTSSLGLRGRPPAGSARAIQRSDARPADPPEGGVGPNGRTFRILTPIGDVARLPAGQLRPHRVPLDRPHRRRGMRGRPGREADAARTGWRPARVLPPRQDTEDVFLAWTIWAKEHRNGGQISTNADVSRNAQRVPGSLGYRCRLRIRVSAHQRQQGAFCRDCRSLPCKYLQINTLSLAQAGPPGASISSTPSKECIHFDRRVAARIENLARNNFANAGRRHIVRELRAIARGAIALWRKRPAIKRGH